MIINGVDDAGPIIASYTAPSDGAAPVVAGDLQVPVQGLADDVARLAAGRQTVSATLSRALRFPPEYKRAEWDYDDLVGCWEQSDVSGSTYLEWGLEVPHGATVVRVYITVKHRSPGGSMGTRTMPQAQLVRKGTTGTQDVAPSSLFSQDDTSASVGTYGAEHSILMNAINHVVDRDFYRYAVRLRGEFGVSAAAGLAVFGVKVDYTPGASRDMGAS